MLPAALMLLVAGIVVGLVASSADAHAQASCRTEDAHVLEVDGRLDAVLVDFVSTQIEGASESCTAVIVLQLNSNGVGGETGNLDNLIQTIEASPVPIGVWVGPSGSRATGEAMHLLTAADRTGIAVGSSIEVTSELLEARDITVEQLGTTRIGERVGADRAIELDLVDSDAPVVREFIVDLPGVESRATNQGDEPGRELTTPVVFSKLPLLGQLMHTVASPAVAYLLFVSGLALLLFELYTAGVGIAGMAGACSLVLGCYGLNSLPTRPIGVVLLFVAMFAYGVDVQTGVPRVWTGIGTVSFALGSFLLFEGVLLSWITLIGAVVGMTLAMRLGMPTMVRTRFATSALSAAWMVGEEGTACSSISPDGVVVVGDATWRAHTTQPTPIDKDEPVRVVATDGLTLTVEPVYHD